MESQMHRNQKTVFQEIRNYLAGRALGATRDEALLDEVMKCLLIRKHMLHNGAPPQTENPQLLSLAPTKPTRTI